MTAIANHHWCAPHRIVRVREPRCTQNAAGEPESDKISLCNVDDDSVDVTIVADKTFGTLRRAPKLDVQMKCTETDDGAGEVCAYPLSIKNYDDLRDTELHAPRILVVLCVPRDLTGWLEESDLGMMLRRTAYWHSLRGEPDVTNTVNKTVHLQRSNRFTVGSLKSMMVRIGEGGLP